MLKMAIDFKFKLTSETDFQIDFFMEINNRWLKYAFNKSKKKLSKKLKKDIEADLNVIEEFEIPEDVKGQLLPILKRALGGKVSDVAAMVKDDSGIIIQKYAVENAYYVRDGDKWKVDLRVVGQWSK